MKTFTASHIELFLRIDRLMR